MSQPKLTLSVDPAVVEAAKAYAADHETSVSRLVEEFLACLAADGAPREAPVLARLRGSLAGADVGDHRKHLVAKYLG